MNSINKTDYLSCRVCGEDSIYIFTGMLLKKHKVKYYECTGCEYIQTENPFWIQEAYINPITESDTGIMIRNQFNTRVVLATLLLQGDLNNTVIDYAGGYGILVRMLRDIGINAFWSDKYSENLFAKGFEYKEQKSHLVTVFEAFEHFINPSIEFQLIRNMSSNILISTEIMPSPFPKIENWWYYGIEHGQHIGFFRLKTLKFLAMSNNMELISDGFSYHLFTDKKYNIYKWIFLRKLLKIFPQLVTSRVKSKVWSDHLLKIK